MRGVKNIDLLLHVKNNIFHLFPQKSYPMHTTVQVLGVAPSPACGGGVRPSALRGGGEKHENKALVFLILNHFAIK
jgi:hypothetical protein